MASDSAKRRIKRNTQFLRMLIISAVAIGACTVIGNRIFRRTFLSIPLVASIIVEAIILGMLGYLVNPKFIKTSRGLEIKDGGVDLHGRGLIRIFIDMLYTFYAVEVLGIFFGRKAFILMLIIPVTAYYEIFRRMTVQKKTQ
ncbi:hypothetical protein NEPAR04_0239 [Nematocida parisii]|nr:hypothetical protein NEPAR08_0233 [Nematocida parisii]KAI5126162.1 hypothetical protein NEPAR03_0334 [Nematocida parisii]KAI5140407.1 hypothetical protein NEPAR04_0239 [Nematocida parisii]